MTSVLETYPLRLNAPEVRAALAALSTIYRRAEIEKVVEDAGLPLWQIAFHERADLSWREVLRYANGQGKVPQLLDAAIAERGSLAVVLTELRSDEPVVAADRPATEDAPTWKNFSDDGDG